MPTTDISRKFDALAYQVDKSMRYHQRMRGWYDTCNRLVLFLIIAAGGGSVIADPQPLVFGASVLAALNLVWAPSHKARDHHLLHGRFSDLMIRMQEGKAEVLEQERPDILDEWCAIRVRIEKDELPIFYALEADCDNDMRRALGRTQQMVPITGWHKVTMYFLRHRPEQFQT